MVVILTAAPVNAAVLTLDETIEVWHQDIGGTFDLSVYPGMESYSGKLGAVTGDFGDGVVRDYRFFYTVDGDDMFSYADGGAGVVEPVPSPPPENVSGNQNWADVWTTSDPGVGFVNPADFTNPTIACAQNIVGTIDISLLTSGTVYVIYGSYQNPNTISLTMSGPGQTDLVQSHPEDPPARNILWMSVFSFSDASAYDTITYTYTNTDVDASRARFMGVILAGVADPNLPFVDVGSDIITWSGQMVELDPNVVDNGTTGLTILWTADDPAVVFDPSATVEDPNVTITKPTTITTAIAIDNPGFEAPPQGEGLYSNNFDDSGWTAFDGAFGGVWNISAANYGGVAPDGGQIAYVYTGTAGIEQDLAETVKADTTYTLTVEVGNNLTPIAAWTGYTVQLLAGETVIAADDNSKTIAADDFETSTVVYASGADDVADPNVGQNLKIRLLSLGGGEVNFDDVQLSAEGPPPEPYTVTLTLAVNNLGSSDPDVRDYKRIYVYDDACTAARVGKDLAADNPSDLDENCITDGTDLADLAEKWLTGNALTGPVPKP